MKSCFLTWKKIPNTSGSYSLHSGDYRIDCERHSVLRGTMVDKTRVRTWFSMYFKNEFIDGRSTLREAKSELQLHAERHNNEQRIITK